MSAKHTPTEIKLHQKSRILEISFTSGDTFQLPCEYLRTHARSAEIETSTVPVFGKADVNIERIEPQGNYALRLYFDDGYDSGIFSWDTLFELGEHYEDYWQTYLQALEKHGLHRHPADRTTTGKTKIRLLYFMNNLLQVTRNESEELELPASVEDIAGLMQLLSRRGARWKKFFAEPDAVRVTVNKQFAESFTRLEAGDEVAFVPTSKDI
jgi:DUF971 family protein/molybdopterin converting factor small subunit